MTNDDTSDTVFYDLASPLCLNGSERAIELVAQVAAGAILAWFSLGELKEELTRFKQNKRKLEVVK